MYWYLELVVDTGFHWPKSLPGEWRIYSSQRRGCPLRDRHTPLWELPLLKSATLPKCACFPGQRITHKSRGTKVWVPPGMIRVMPAPGILLGSGLSRNYTAAWLLPCQPLLLPYVSNKHPAQNSWTQLAPRGSHQCMWKHLVNSKELFNPKPRPQIFLKVLQAAAISFWLKPLNNFIGRESWCPTDSVLYCQKVMLRSNQEVDSNKLGFYRLVNLQVNLIIKDVFIAWLWREWASQVVLVVKNPPANAGDTRDAGSIPGSGSSLRGGHGNPLQYSCLENPMDSGAWWSVQSNGSQRVGHDWSDLARTHVSTDKEKIEKWSNDQKLSSDLILKNWICKTSIKHYYHFFSVQSLNKKLLRISYAMGERE